MIVVKADMIVAIGARNGEKEMSNSIGRFESVGPWRAPSLGLVDKENNGAR